MDVLTMEAATVLPKEEAAQSQSLRDHVLSAMDSYFSCFKGTELCSVHSVVLDEVESAIYEAVMERFDFPDLRVSTRGLRLAAVMEPV